jgi:TolB-like protein/tRNA A-37 threonylcarbamoyl transferase component Bud32/Flp pilus assembly protein TadD
MSARSSSSRVFLAELQAALEGTHTIERELGGGGMSRVYVAEEKALRRPVVIKVLAPELAAELSAERFAREIQLSASLQQANIIPVIGAGTASGLPYYTMPFVEGLSLRARLLRDGAMPANEAIAALRDVARALAFAHGRGVVHRDIKPDNVLLSGGTAVVTDFGVAKALTEAQRDLTRTSGAMGTALTRYGMTVGTPAYMSPEQAAGDPEIDHRSDLYSWAMMAYELLSGRHPFAEKHTPQALIVAQLTVSPPPVQDALPDLPVAIGELIMQCLEKDPADRPADAETAIRMIDSTSAQLVAMSPRSARPVNSIAVLPFANLSADPENEYFADGITEEVLNGLAQVRGLHVVARTSSFQFKGKHLDLRTIGDQLKVRRVLEGSVRRAGSRVRITTQLVNVDDGFHVWSEKYDRELADIFEVQDEIARAIVAQLKASFDTGAQAVATPMLGTALRIENTEAYEAFLKGRVYLDQRVEGIAMARAAFERSVQLDPNFAPARAHLATISLYESLYHVRAPRDGFAAAREEASRALALEPRSSQAHVVLGYVALFHDWDAATALEHLETADQLNPPTFSSLILRSNFEFARGNTEAALQNAEDAVRLDPLALEPRINFCMVLYFEGHFERAVREAEGSMERSVVLSETLRFKGLSLMALGRLDEALEVLERAVTVSYRSAWSLTSYAMALHKLGRLDDVAAIDRELRERATVTWVPPLLLAAMACMRDDFDEAREDIVRSFEARDYWLPCVPRDAELLQLFTRDRTIPAVFARVGLPLTE